MIKDVLFEPVEGLVNNDVDEAYRFKYSSSAYLKAMIGDQAKSATVKIVPFKIE